MTPQNGPDQKRRLKETDIDPSGELTSDRSGETEGTGPGTGSRTDNQPAENREDPTRSETAEAETGTAKTLRRQATKNG